MINLLIINFGISIIFYLNKTSLNNNEHQKYLNKKKGRYPWTRQN